MATTIVLGMMSGSARGVGVGTWQSRSAGASQGSTDAGQGSMDAVVGGFSRSPEKRQSEQNRDIRVILDDKMTARLRLRLRVRKFLLQPRENKETAVYLQHSLCMYHYICTK